MKAELKKQLGALGVAVPENPDGEVPQDYQAELKAFLGGFDFMKLGQAVNRKQWESAMMTIRRMEQRCDALGLEGFKRSFAGIRQAVVRKDVLQAKQLLAAVIQRRVRLFELLSDHSGFKD